MKILALLLFIQLSFTSFAQSDTVYCQVYGSGSTSIEWTNTNWELNGALQEYDGCADPSLNPSIHVAVIDMDSCKAWASCSGLPNQNFNQINQCGVCRGRPEKYFIFRLNDSISMAYLDTMLTHPILTNHKLLLYSYTFIDFTYLNTNYPNTIQIFQNLGFDSVTNYSGIRPFIFFTEVGLPSSAIQVYGQSSNSFISLTAVYNECSIFNSIDEISSSNLIYPTILENGEAINVIFESLQIFDISGKMIQSQQNPNSQFRIENYIPGIYFMKIKNGDSEFVRKFVVK